MPKMSPREDGSDIPDPSILRISSKDVPVKVQGDKAVEDITCAIKYFNNKKRRVNNMDK